MPPKAGRTPSPQAKTQTQPRPSCSTSSIVNTTIDEVIAFSQGAAKDVLGEEAATGMLAQAKKIKAEGGKYCFCAECVATQKLLAKHGRPVL